MRQNDMLRIEELETRYELASLAAAEEADGGCCSGSCCLVGGNCGTPAPEAPSGT